MANEEHLKMLRQGVRAWNKWRQKHQEIQPDLIGANLEGVDLSRANLEGVDLSRVNLSRAKLSRAYLFEASLSGAHLSQAHLREANLNGANLYEVDLSQADLSQASLSTALLRRADLSGANLRKALQLHLGISAEKHPPSSSDKGRCHSRSRIGPPEHVLAGCGNNPRESVHCS